MMNREFFFTLLTKFMLIAIAAIYLLSSSGFAEADLATPAWYDPDGVGAGQDWHFRVPVAIPNFAAVDGIIRVDVDFNALLSQIGASGTFDTDSPRVVRTNGVLCATQQYTDTVYSGASDAAANGRGEIRFLLEDDGPTVYFLYFDIQENGAKSPWNVNNTINGNFEFSSNSQQDPPGWNGRIYRTGYQAMAIVNDLGHVVADPNGSPSSISTDETARSGQYCYMLGARDNAEPADRDPSTRLERTIAVPVTNPGVIRVRYRIKGWDSSDNNFNDWDQIRIQIIRGGTTEIVGPSAGNYTTLPFSPNFGRNNATTFRSGYGPFNYFDADTTGTHHSGMTITPGSAPWFTVTQDLTPWAGRNITLRILTRNSTLYKSWFHVDDVEWSVSDGLLGTPQSFGVNIIAPNDTTVSPATIYYSGDILIIQARLDAHDSGVTATLFDPGGNLIQNNIILFNDGSHGDASAGDAIWTNDGSVPAQTTYQFLATDPPGSNWQVVANAATSGTTVTDVQVFTLVTPPNIVLLKSVRTFSDPINATTNPKAIPGAVMEYTITAVNTGGTGVDSDSIVVIDAVPVNTALYVGDLGQPFGPVVFIDGSPASGLIYTGLGSDIAYASSGPPYAYTYTPVPDAQGFDPNVTALRINPKGIFNGGMNGSNPQFTLQFRVRLR